MVCTLLEEEVQHCLETVCFYFISSLWSGEIKQLKSSNIFVKVNTIFSFFLMENDKKKIITLILWNILLVSNKKINVCLEKFPS